MVLIKEKMPSNLLTFLGQCVKCTQNEFIPLMILHWAEFGSFFSWIRPTYIGSVIIYYSC